MRKNHRKYVGKLSPEREADMADVRKKLDLEMADLGPKVKANIDASRARKAKLADVFCALRVEREKRGLSLADMSERTGMAREIIQRLETLVKPNPTIDTIQRYAAGLGLEVKLQFVKAAKNT